MNRNATALILVVLAIGIYFTYTQGQIAKIESIQAVNSQYGTAIANSQKLIELRQQVLAEYNSISDADKARLDKIVPSNVDNVRLMIDVSGIAARHGLTAAGITTSADTSSQAAGSAAAGQNSGLSVVSVSFTVNTSYDNFLAFLQDIERSLRILDVTEITLSPAANGNYAYAVTLNTYWLNQ